MTKRDSDLEALRTAIESAFQGSEFTCKCPEDLVIISTPSEYPTLAPWFAGKKWEDWKDSPMDIFAPHGYSGGIMFLQPDAFRYFLPVFLLACILQPREADKLIDEVVDSIIRPKEDGGRWWHDAVFSSLTPAQLFVVHQTIEFLDEHYARQGSPFHKNLGRARFSLSYHLTPRKKLP